MISGDKLTEEKTITPIDEINEDVDSHVTNQNWHNTHDDKADRMQIISDDDDFDTRTPEIVNLNDITENNDTTIGSKNSRKMSEKNLVDNSMKHYQFDVSSKEGFKELLRF